MGETVEIRKDILLHLIQYCKKSWDFIDDSESFDGTNRFASEKIYRELVSLFDEIDGKFIDPKNDFFEFLDGLVK